MRIQNNAHRNRSAERPVSRVEIADYIESAFTQPPVSKAHLLEAAAETNAREEVLLTLARLPDRDFRTMRDLWLHLAEVPVDLA